jgi:hypothetical protein
MPRNYVRKTHTVYSDNDLKQAINAVRGGHLSSGAAAEKFKIPRTTLYGRLSGRRGDTGRGVRPILSSDEEKFLVHVIVTFQEWQQPLTRSSIITMARTYMQELEKPVAVDSALIEWFKGFMKRWAFELKMVKSTKLEKARSVSCTSEVVCE